MYYIKSNQYNCSSECENTRVRFTHLIYRKIYRLSRTLSGLSWFITHTHTSMIRQVPRKALRWPTALLWVRAPIYMRRVIHAHQCSLFLTSKQSSPTLYPARMCLPVSFDGIRLVRWNTTGVVCPLLTPACLPGNQHCLGQGDDRYWGTAFEYAG